MEYLIKSRIATKFLIWCNRKELKVNGYEVLKGKRLKEFKLLIKDLEVTDMNVAQLHTAQKRADKTMSINPLESD